MLGNENYPQEARAGAAIDKLAYRDDVTVRQNIDSKIKRHQEAIAQLEQSKVQLAPLLDMRLDLMREAMQR